MKLIQSVGLIGVVLAICLAGCTPTPVDIKIEKEKYVLDGSDAQDKIVATPIDKDGNPIKEGVDLTFFCPSTKVVKVSQDGAISAVSSGEDIVEVEAVGTDLKVKVPVRVKIPASIEVSHEKLRLWTGQEKQNVAAWVHSEKGAFIEGYIPKWSSDDPSIVSVEQIEDPVKDPKRARSYVKLTGLKSGDTYIVASYGHMSQNIRVRVYNEDEEVDLAGRRKPADAQKNKE